LPSDLPAACVEQLYAGMAHECGLWNARLVGGDTARCDKFIISITAVGHKSSTDSTCLRSNCRVGQNIFVSGALGGSRAGLELLGLPSDHALRRKDFALPLIQRQQIPTPRVSLGRFLAREYPEVAIIDISDSLYNELHLLGQASGTGFDVQLSKIPFFAHVGQYCREAKRDPITFALGSGEEYELLFCCNANADEIQSGLAGAGIHVPVTWIGTVTHGSQIRFLNESNTVVPVCDETFRHYKS
jgi:thiamine-monophosphate kinase